MTRSARIHARARLDTGWVLREDQGAFYWAAPFGHTRAYLFRRDASALVEAFGGQYPDSFPPGLLAPPTGLRGLRPLTRTEVAGLRAVAAAPTEAAPALLEHWAGLLSIRPDAVLAAAGL